VHCADRPADGAGISEREARADDRLHRPGCGGSPRADDGLRGRPGDPITGSYTYSLDVADTNADKNVADYFYSAPPYGSP